MVHVFFFQNEAAEEFNDIDFASVKEVRRQLEASPSLRADETEIHLWIDSIGGSADSAYKLACLLRARSRRLVAIVPDYAKSAATLLALAADELFMDDGAELGPLDAQISHQKVLVRFDPNVTTALARDRNVTTSP